MIHIRRCHICSQTSESEDSKIERCNSCGKYLAPFVFCSDPMDAADMKLLTEPSRPQNAVEKSLLKSVYPPIYGISLYW